MFRVHLNLAALCAQSQSSITKFLWMPSGTAESKFFHGAVSYSNFTCLIFTTNIYTNLAILHGFLIRYGWTCFLWKVRIWYGWTCFLWKILMILCCFLIVINDGTSCKLVPKTIVSSVEKPIKNMLKILFAGSPSQRTCCSLWHPGLLFVMCGTWSLKIWNLGKHQLNLLRGMSHVADTWVLVGVSTSWINDSM